jgi:hypothetical protein
MARVRENNLQTSCHQRSNYCKRSLNPNTVHLRTRDEATVLLWHPEEAVGDRRISKYEMLCFAQHDKKMKMKGRASSADYKPFKWTVLDLGEFYKHKLWLRLLLF